MSMQRMFEQNSVLYRDEIALRDLDAVLTYGELRDRALRLANALRGLGLGPGDRVAWLYAGNNHRIYEIYFAACEAGLIEAPLNVRLTTEELASYVRYVGATVLFSDATLGPVAQEVAGLVPSIRHVIGHGDGHGLSIDYERLLEESSPAELDIEHDPTLPVLLSPTSGTTGSRAKGALISQMNTYLGALGWLSGYNLRPQSRYMIGVPLFFASAAPGHFLGLFLGAEMTILPRFEPEAFARVVETNRITHALLAPAMMYQVMDAGIDLARLKSLEVLGCGGSAFDETRLRSLVEQMGRKVYVTYGLTEASATATVLRPSDYLTDDDELTPRYTSIGKPWLGVGLRVVHDDGSWVKFDKSDIGEIVLRGDVISSGYWEMPDETAETFRDGWLHTGDLATVDGDGYVYVVDRMKDIIVTGGINVSSLEVEQALGRHRDVLSAAVVGIPSEQWGEAIHAFVVARPGSSLTADELVEHCRGELASFKKPQSIEFVEQLPMSSTGKVLKRELREPFWRGRTRQVG